MIKEKTPERINIKSFLAISIILLSVFAFVVLLSGNFKTEKAFGDETTTSNLNPYLEIRALQDNTQVKLFCGKTDTPPNLEKKTNSDNWFSEVEFVREDSEKGSNLYANICTLNAGDYVLLRGFNEHGFSDLSQNRICTFSIDKEYALTGSVMGLVDYGLENRAIPADSDGCFAFLFQEKIDGVPQTLKYVSPNLLPATMLAKDCYHSMFKHCALLDSAPDLPSYILSNACYQSMFFGCTSLNKAPNILPAITLCENCYFEMFCNCEKLVRAPRLDGKSLVKGCYEYMFDGCSSLSHLEVSFNDWNTEGTDAYPGTFSWFRNMNYEGEFICPDSLPVDARYRGNNYVPVKWIVNPSQTTSHKLSWNDASNIDYVYYMDGDIQVVVDKGSQVGDGTLLYVVPNDLESWFNLSYQYDGQLIQYKYIKPGVMARFVMPSGDTTISISY